MLLIIGLLVGMNLAIRVVIGEARKLGLKGHVSVRGQTPITLRDLAAVALKGGLFLVVPVAIGVGLDYLLGTTVGALFE